MPESILLVTGIFPPDSGGPSKFSMDFGIWAASKNTEVVVQTYSDKRNSMEQIGPIRVFTIPRSRTLAYRYALMIHGIGQKVSQNTAVLTAGAFLETYIASLMYRFSYVAKVPGDIVWERARNNKITNLGISEFQNQKLTYKYRLFRKLFSNSLKRARLVIVPSQGLYDLCLNWGVQQERLRLVYNSVEYKKASAVRTGEYEYDLVTICRLAPWKGVDELIAYCAERNFRMAVAGDGPDRSRLEKLAQTLDAKVTFMGIVSSESIFHLLNISKIFVLNSYYEGLPHALVEARVAGTISVGRSGTGSEEVINDDVDGYLIRPDRPLETTLDLAISSVTNSNLFTQKAKDDANARFNKETNFREIARLIRGGK